MNALINRMASRGFLLPLLSAVLSLILTTFLVGTLGRPRIKIVGTYWRGMPWESLIARKSSNLSLISNVVDTWGTLSSEDLSKVFPKEHFDLLSIRDAEWTRWDDVAEAKRSLGAFDQLLFKDYSRLLEQCGVLAKQDPAKRDYVTVAMTPEREGFALSNRLDAFCQAVRKYLPDKQVKAVPCASYDSVVSGLANGSIDFALLSPYSTMIVREALSNDVVLLGQTWKNPIGGYADGYKVVLIKSDDEYAIPKDFEKITIIYASEYSTSGYLIPLRMLNGLGVNLSKLHIDRRKLFHSHDSVINKVQSEVGSLAGVPSDKLEPRFAAVRTNTWRGSILGSAIGTLLCYAYYVIGHFRKPR